VPKKDTNQNKKKQNKANEKKEQKRGRKSKYDTHVKPYLNRIPKWRRNGMTEAQIAKKLGIAMSSFSLYKLKHSEFSEALKNSKEELIENLEDSLFRRAMGYSYEETKIEKESDGRAKITKTTKELPPDVGALIFALKNLVPGKWKNDDRYIVEKNDAEEKRADMHQITLEALKSRIVPGFNDEDESKPEKEAGEGA
jgi:transcriptional regulator with XRE-family HTH domain